MRPGVSWFPKPDRQTSQIGGLTGRRIGGHTRIWIAPACIWFPKLDWVPGCVSAQRSCARSLPREVRPKRVRILYDSEYGAKMTQGVWKVNKGRNLALVQRCQEKLAQVPAAVGECVPVSLTVHCSPQF